MKIVVTGALGHIGSRLIRALPIDRPGTEVVMVDDMSTQRYASLFDLPSAGRYRFVEDDVCTMDLAPHLHGAAAVIHLAAITDATGSFGRKDEVERVNFSATERVARACIAAGVPMLFPSSTSVYGTQAAQVDEDCAPEALKPQSPYAETKLREEAMLRDLAGRAGLKVAICRFGTIFGVSAGMRFHTAVNKFAWQAVMGRPLTVWRTAYEQKRPYLDVEDAVRCVALFLRHGGFDGRVYNVVTLNATVRDIVDAIRRYVPDLEIGFVDERIMNQLSYEVLTPRMDAKGFRPRGDLSRGIGDTVRLLRQASRVYEHPAASDAA